MTLYNCIIENWKTYEEEKQELVGLEIEVLFTDVDKQINLVSSPVFKFDIVKLQLVFGELV
ncbi:hypothetical protein Bhyg_12172 [Pseudolycoriella hygida]|uniref:Uncharacterized protein n=1 Tax=Pseudolycoriella hygida TaxID=35572 RepID=A0A9Q0MWR2_9DIPT|nr:hypothetical protein Bhyg_12172 [Pseudolycoriella hygida]